MIDIVMPCVIANSNKIELVTIGQCDLSWSPNWSNLFNTTSKVLIYDIISDNSLIDSEVVINVGHTSIKLNDLKFLFKLNGIHSNAKLYYDELILNKLIKYSIPSYVLMTILNIAQSPYFSGTVFSELGETSDLSDFISFFTEQNRPQGGDNDPDIALIDFTKEFLKLSINDDLSINVVYDNNRADSAYEAHRDYNAYISKKRDEIKQASEYACNKLISLLQLNKAEYDRVKDSPIPAGPMAFIPVRPNFTRATIFQLTGSTAENTVEGYSSGILHYKCGGYLTSSFWLYADNGNIIITDKTVAFRPVLIGSKDPQLYKDINGAGIADKENILNSIKNLKLFNEVKLNLDLLNKAFKALMSGDLLYFYAITGQIIRIGSTVGAEDLVINTLTEDVQSAINSYTALSIALGGVRRDA